MSVLERVQQQEDRPPGAQAGTEDEERRSRREMRARLKDELVQRLGIEAMSAMVSGSDIGRVRDELRVTCQAILNAPEFEGTSAAVRETLISQVLDEICGLGPIQGLLDDDTVTEVMVNGPGRLFYERAGRICPADVAFESAEQIMVAVDRILAPLGRRLDRASPLVNARLPNGDRVNAVALPIAIDGPVVTIRKFSNRSWWDSARCRSGTRRCSRGRCTTGRTSRWREARDRARRPCSTRCPARSTPRSAS